MLARCLASLFPSPHEVLVVENASSDGSADMVARMFPRATLLRRQQNLGFAGAINVAARRASGRYLLLLNSDAEAGQGSIEALANFLDSYQDCGAVAGELQDAAGRPQRGWNVRRFPTLSTFAVDLLLVGQMWPGNPVSRRYRADDLDYSRPIEVDQPAAACLMVRRAAFDQIGGMDDRFYPAWFEDVDFCRRLRDAGWRIYFLPEAAFLHHGGVAMRHLGLREFSLAWYRNLERYVRKHHGPAALLLIKALVTIGMLERMAVSLATRNRPALGAYAAVFRQTLTGSRRA